MMGNHGEKLQVDNSSKRIHSSMAAVEVVPKSAFRLFAEPRLLQN